MYLIDRGKISSKKRKKSIGVHRCINKLDNSCLLCKLDFGKSKTSKGKRSYHHISSLPAITVLVCKDCHYKIEHDTTGKYDYLRPAFNRREARFLMWAYLNKGSLKKLTGVLRHLKNVY